MCSYRGAVQCPIVNTHNNAYNKINTSLPIVLPCSKQTAIKPRQCNMPLQYREELNTYKSITMTNSLVFLLVAVVIHSCQSLPNRFPVVPDQTEGPIEAETSKLTSNCGSTGMQGLPGPSGIDGLLGPSTEMQSMKSYFQYFANHVLYVFLHIEHNIIFI